MIRGARLTPASAYLQGLDRGTAVGKADGLDLAAQTLLDYALRCDGSRALLTDLADYLSDMSIEMIEQMEERHG